MKFLIKITLLFSLFLGIFGNSYAGQATPPATSPQQGSTWTMPSAWASSAWQNSSSSQWSSWEEKDSCTWNWDCLGSSNYTFSTSKFVPGWTFKIGESTKKRVDWGLLTIIQRLMIPFWVISVIILTIWAWFMILSGWMDEHITKWKKIFKMWLISISVALCSYLLVELLKYLLYT